MKFPNQLSCMFSLVKTRPGDSFVDDHEELMKNFLRTPLLKPLKLNGQQGEQNGICIACKKPAPSLLNGFCPSCLTPCDLSSGNCNSDSEEKR